MQKLFEDLHGINKTSFLTNTTSWFSNSKCFPPFLVSTLCSAMTLPSFSSPIIRAKYHLSTQQLQKRFAQFLPRAYTPKIIDVQSPGSMSILEKKTAYQWIDGRTFFIEIQEPLPKIITIWSEKSNLPKIIHHKIS